MSCLYTVSMASFLRLSSFLLRREFLSLSTLTIRRPEESVKRFSITFYSYKYLFYLYLIFYYEGSLGRKWTPEIHACTLRLDQYYFR